jgi:5-(carboxyamino)imidazole ribonucleotide synthase
MSTQRIGVLGAGQLALMLAQAAGPLGVEVLCAGSADDCAAQAATILPTDLADAASVARFAAQVDALTLESENIDAHVLAGLNVFPNAHAVGVAQDRLAEKRFLQSCGIAVAPFAPVDCAADIAAAAAQVGLPGILKTRRMGYDGKGQARLSALAQAESAWQAIGAAPAILEGMVPFEAEVSLVGARARDGATVFYPLTENVHREGILRVSRAPSSWPALQAEAEACMARVFTALDYIGVLAIEFFVHDGALIANEMAPRVHNSGHWTIEGAVTSQFENALRAIAGLPLGSTASRPTVMLNCIGVMPPAEETAPFISLHRHDYGKQPRPGRKVGHLTFAAEHAADIAVWEARLA